LLFVKLINISAHITGGVEKRNDERMTRTVPDKGHLPRIYIGVKTTERTKFQVTFISHGIISLNIHQVLSFSFTEFFVC